MTNVPAHVRTKRPARVVAGVLVKPRPVRATRPTFDGTYRRLLLGVAFGLPVLFFALLIWSMTSTNAH